MKGPYRGLLPSWQLARARHKLSAPQEKAPDPGVMGWREGDALQHPAGNGGGRALQGPGLSPRRWQKPPPQPACNKHLPATPHCSPWAHSCRPQLTCVRSKCPATRHTPQWGLLSLREACPLATILGTGRLLGLHRPASSPPGSLSSSCLLSPLEAG